MKKTFVGLSAVAFLAVAGVFATVGNASAKPSVDKRPTTSTTTVDWSGDPSVYVRPPGTGSTETWKPCIVEDPDAPNECTP